MFLIVCSILQLFVSLEQIAQSLWGFTKLKPKQYPDKKCQKTKIIVFNFRLILLDRSTYCVEDLLHVCKLTVGTYPFLGNI